MLARPALAVKIRHYQRLFATKIAGVLFVIRCRHIEEPMNDAQFGREGSGKTITFSMRVECTESRLGCQTLGNRLKLNL